MKKILMLLSLLSVALSGVSQGSTLYSSYFLDRMPLRHKLNAALMPDQGYVAIPVLGGINMNVGGTAGMENFLYQSATDAGTLNTLMHPDVSAEQALGNLSSTTGLDFNFNINLISFGLFKWGGYNTFDMSVTAYGSVGVAKNLFSFLKQGQTSDVTNYSLAGTAINTTAYSQIAFGHARKITDKLTVGAKFKYLLGFASARIGFDDGYISLSDDQWIINSGASGNLAMSGASLVDGSFEFDSSQMGLAGNGIAFDFGATYRLFDEIWVLDGIELSAAINDLGFITWAAGNNAITSTGEYIYTGFEDDIDLFGDGSSSLGDQMEGVVDDISSAFDLETVSGAERYSQMLAMSMTAGGEAIFLDDRVTVGVLYTTFLRQGISAGHQGMFSLNLKPLSWINGAIAYSASTYGSNFGGVLNICPKGFNFFVGADYGVPKMTTSYIPVDAKFGLNLSMGIIFTFGEVFDFN